MQSILEDTTRPKKTKSARSSAEILDEIKTAPIDYRRARQVALGTEREALDAERYCANSLIFSHPATDEIDDPNHGRGAWHNLGADLAKAAGLRFLADTLAKNETVLEARQALDALFSELATAQENERIEAAKASQAAQDLRDAKAAARAELESKLDDHPAVVAAQRKLEPYRRKGEIVA
jgi:hypothetical protein